MEQSSVFEQLIAGKEIPEISERYDLAVPGLSDQERYFGFVEFGVVRHEVVFAGQDLRRASSTVEYHAVQSADTDDEPQPNCGGILTIAADGYRAQAVNDAHAHFLGSTSEAAASVLHRANLERFLHHQPQVYSLEEVIDLTDEQFGWFTLRSLLTDHHVTHPVLRQYIQQKVSV